VVNWHGRSLNRIYLLWEPLYSYASTSRGRFAYALLITTRGDGNRFRLSPTTISTSTTNWPGSMMKDEKTQSSVFGSIVDMELELKSDILYDRWTDLAIAFAFYF